MECRKCHKIFEDTDNDDYGAIIHIMYEGDSLAGWILCDDCIKALLSWTEASK